MSFPSNKDKRWQAAPLLLCDCIWGGPAKHNNVCAFIFKSQMLRTFYAQFIISFHVFHYSRGNGKPGFYTRTIKNGYSLFSHCCWFLVNIVQNWLEAEWGGWSRGWCQPTNNVKEKSFCLQLEEVFVRVLLCRHEHSHFLIPMLLISSWISFGQRLTSTWWCFNFIHLICLVNLNMLIIVFWAIFSFVKIMKALSPPYVVSCFSLVRTPYLLKSPQ